MGFLRKVEAVKLQSFLDAEFGKYMRDNPGDEKLPLAAKRARWSRDHYYFFCKQFLYTEALEQRSFAYRFGDGVFIPFWRQRKCRAWRRRSARENVAKVKPQWLSAVDEALWKEWADVVK